MCIVGLGAVTGHTVLVLLEYSLEHCNYYYELLMCYNYSLLLVRPRKFVSITSFRGRILESPDMPHPSYTSCAELEPSTNTLMSAL